MTGKTNLPDSVQPSNAVPKKRLSLADKEKIWELYTSGEPIDEIAKAMSGIAISTLQGHLRRMRKERGEQSRTQLRHEQTQALKEKVWELYISGEKTTEIAKKVPEFKLSTIRLYLVQMRKEKGYQKTQQKLSAAQARKDKIWELHNNGKTIDEIAEILPDIKRKTIEGYLSILRREHKTLSPRAKMNYPMLRAKIRWRLLAGEPFKDIVSDLGHEGLIRLIQKELKAEKELEGLMQGEHYETSD